MNATTRMLLIALLSLPLLAACQKEEAPAVDPSAAKAPLTRPATNDDAEWGAYLSDVVTRNMGDITRSPYLYYLPASGTPGFEGARARLQEEVEVAMQREYRKAGAAFPMRARTNGQGQMDHLRRFAAELQ